ncbi:hypothetical protein L1049_014308 [Liquidambar formosana]|uniref:Protein kinase domain-containing protein n=1 Tax=Liquidambar formosana TaxID=63359 RepID=A0AAP0WZL5_LIQFO
MDELGLSQAPVVLGVSLGTIMVPVYVSSPLQLVLSDSTLAELLAIREALKIFCQSEWVNISNLIIEFDSSVAVSWEVNSIVDWMAKVVPGAMFVAAIIVGVVITIFVLLLRKCLKKRKKEERKRKYFIQNGGAYLRRLISTGALVGDSKVFSPEELEIATDGFNENRILGRGGQATVFKAMLRSGRVVAVKRAKTVEEWIRESFINEIIVLLEIKHDNVVGLIGFCLEAEKPLLVYEYIPNGSLYQILHEQPDNFLNSWEVRRRIIREVAEAITYLHAIRTTDFNGICHRDLKSQNILLDQQYRSVLADFGIARFLGPDRSHLTTQAIGSLGYIDPELQFSGEYTKRSDVYSYGVVIAELLTGEKAISRRWGNLAMQLKSAVKNDNISAILDCKIVTEENKNELSSYTKLSRRCLKKKGKNRPFMEDILNELNRLQGLFG